MACVFVSLSTGCTYYAPVMPPQGLLFSNIESTIDIDTDETDLGSRRGESSSYAALGLFSFGKASVAAAAEEGDVLIINHVDYAYLNVIGLFQRFTVIVYGD
ncbi:hypothetical protein JXA47_08795 [Candidatus Sumerlaeota bacterium]|nr:hypothetical protein [Candidatus Sumerlaeota bacterium]